jgi:hypothetical protein
MVIEKFGGPLTTVTQETFHQPEADGRRGFLSAKPWYLGINVPSVPDLRSTALVRQGRKSGLAQNSHPNQLQALPKGMLKAGYAHQVSRAGPVPTRPGV